VLLQKEFPNLKSYELPSYKIKYAKSAKNLKIRLFFNLPSIISAVKKEKILISKLIEKENITGVISDNRFGVFNSKIPSVYITHQLNVLSGRTTQITSRFHQNIIRKFDECWVPDVEGEANFSGELGHLIKHNFHLKYMGILSRFQPKLMESKYHLLVILSGPEPQRTFLENKLLNELKAYEAKVLFVRGILYEHSKIQSTPNFEVVNYLLSKDLEKAINESNLIISRSGYSTIMDLAVLGKKAFFIPTPGQFEQEYLAKRLSEKSIAPFSTQQDFRLDKLSEVKKHTGFGANTTNFDLNLFSLFNSK